MDIQLQELIGKIKKDGIESASAEAARIKAEAQTEAARIVETARKEAETIIARGKADAERSEKAGIAAVEQASRNLILAFKTEVQNLLDKITAKETAAAYSADVLKAVIPEVVKAWGAGKEGGADVILGEKQLKELENHLRGELAGALKGGVDFKFGRSLDAGFRIAEKDGSAYYEFSAESVAAFFSAYLNPRLSETLKNAARGL
jgi:V/A-type H+-transporting ATPase subunit E